MIKKFSTFILILSFFAIALPQDARGADITTDAATNLIACFSMDEASGSRVDDVASYTLTDNNTVGSAVGLFSNAGDFEVTQSEYLNNTSAGIGIGTNSDFSVSFWYKSETTTTHQIFFNTGNGGTTGFIIRGEPGNTIFAQYSNGAGTTKTRTSSAVITDATWQHYVVTFDVSADTFQFYVDGIDQADSPFSTAASGYADGGDFWIGSNPGPGQYVDGLMDEIAIYDTIVSSGVVATLFAGGTGIPCTAEAGGGGEDIKKQSEFFFGKLEDNLFYV